MKRLKRLRDLQDFLLAETVKIREEDATLRGGLNLQVFQLDGQMPTRQDWIDLETCTQTLFGYLNGDLRKKFLLGQAPFICYLAWMISLGAIGAVAFISVNTLSIQTTATFDINNRRLIAVRIVLGALFAVVLSIAFGYQGFSRFLDQVRTATTATTRSAAGVSDSEIWPHALLLLPFLLGFSTTLVIAELNRLVESVGIFFGAQTPAVNGAGTGSPARSNLAAQPMQPVQIAQQ